MLDRFAVYRCTPINNPDEAIARRYLCEAGYTLRHEPKGYKKFPDFDILNGAIGVEVRRLPMMCDGPSALESLDNAAKPLRERVEKLLQKLNRPDLLTSYAIWIKFSRPIPQWITIEKALKAKLVSTQENLLCNNLAIAENIKITVINSNRNLITPPSPLSATNA